MNHISLVVLILLSLSLSDLQAQVPTFPSLRVLAKGP